MTQDIIQKIHRWYSWILATIVIALGILFILSCLDIYTSGPRPYSADAIALRFHLILLPVIVGCIGVLGGIVLNLFLPLEASRKKSIAHPEDAMLLMRNKANIPPVQKEIRLRFIYRLLTALSVVGFMIYPMVYFLTPEHFSISELNSDIIRSIIVTIIPTAASLSLCWICRVLVNKSFQREASIYKEAIAGGQRKSTTNSAVQTKSNRCVLLSIRIVIVVAAIVFIILGIFNGGAKDVLKKAIAICTECIGLG